MQTEERMYEKTKTWNPGVGCLFDCGYCKHSFQVILKVFQGKKCEGCRTYTPHYHPERFTRFPRGCQNIFVFGTGDIAFYDEKFVIKTLEVIKEFLSRSAINEKKTFFFQSKDPSVFEKYLSYFKTLRNIVLITTLETNKDEGYEQISKAPLPSKRAAVFHDLNYSWKIVTIEPILDFDIDEFFDILTHINPYRVYMGYNSRPNKINLPEPSLAKFHTLREGLENWGIEVVVKNKDRLR